MCNSILDTRTLFYPIHHLCVLWAAYTLSGRMRASHRVLIHNIYRRTVEKHTQQIYRIQSNEPIAVVSILFKLFARKKWPEKFSMSRRRRRRAHAAFFSFRNWVRRWNGLIFLWCGCIGLVAYWLRQTHMYSNLIRGGFMWYSWRALESMKRAEVGIGQKNERWRKWKAKKMIEMRKYCVVEHFSHQHFFQIQQIQPI